MDDDEAGGGSYSKKVRRISQFVIDDGSVGGVDDARKVLLVSNKSVRNLAAPQW